MRLVSTNGDEKVDRSDSIQKPIKTRYNSKQMEGNAAILRKHKIGKVGSFKQ